MPRFRGLTVAVLFGEMNGSTMSVKSYKVPPHIIARAVWLCFRFPVSLWLVEDMQLARGIVASYEAIRQGDCKFGAA